MARSVEENIFTMTGMIFCWYSSADRNFPTWHTNRTWSQSWNAPHSRKKLIGLQNLWYFFCSLIYWGIKFAKRGKDLPWRAAWGWQLLRCQTQRRWAAEEGLYVCRSFQEMSPNYHLGPGKTAASRLDLWSTERQRVLIFLKSIHLHINCSTVFRNTQIKGLKMLSLKHCLH